jgi:hypothetical protein
MRLLALVLLFSGTILPARAVDTTPVRAPYREGAFLYFEGRAWADPSAMGKSHSRALSKDAAINDALKKIALYIESLRQKDGRTVKQNLEKDGKLRTQVDAFIKGAETTKMDWEGNGECRVTVRIDRKNLLESLSATETLKPRR